MLHIRKLNSFLSKSILIITGITVLFPLSSAQSDSFAITSRKIVTHERKLKSIRSQIKTLEAEKVKLKKNEEEINETLKSIETEIGKSNNTILRLRNKINDTEKNISNLKNQIISLSNEGTAMKESIHNDLRTYHVFLAYPQNLSAILIDKIALRAQIVNKFNTMNIAATRKELAMKKESDLLYEKETLIVFNSKLINELEIQKYAQEKKNELYKTTQGKRIIAESEVKHLRETSKDLEKLILTLKKNKTMDLASRKRNEYLRKAFQRKRGYYSWPADGTIVSKYGRQKHPDLDITVINSGVKIRTNPNNPVTSVNKGTVIYASDFRSYGQTVIVDHGGDSYTVYGLLGNILVKEGEKVRAGDLVGESSPNQESLVYFEVRNQGKPENPLIWLK